MPIRCGLVEKNNEIRMLIFLTENIKMDNFLEFFIILKINIY